ncbi:MAG: bifunctional phosphoglucose/phosphomannose isomerase [Armatimonadota bacterium]|nr:bifunctional phosphoglucose/phosphomannose isomerase [Armatimonadota bacterium]
MVLDDPGGIARLDTAGMLGLIGRAGSMASEGWHLAADLAPPATPPAAVVVCGMGGSGIAGEVLQALLADQIPVPVLSVKDERIPSSVDSRTWFFACSYSGETEETLAAYEQACRRRAQVVAVTSGGRLADLADRRGHPVVRVPAGLPPRAALPYLLVPMVRLVARAGGGAEAEEGMRRQVDEAARLLDDLTARWGPAVPLSGNPAKALAVALEGAIPVVYAGSAAMAPAAQRWKTQFNENSKVPAAWNAFPELTHNEIVGWEGVTGGAPPFHVVFLRDREDGAANARRLEAARERLVGRARGAMEVWSHGVGRLARMLSLILLGDYASAYLAVLRRVDPTPIEAIRAIKQHLARP